MGGEYYRFGSTDQLLEAEGQIESSESALGPAPARKAGDILEQFGSPSLKSGGDTGSNPPTAWTTGLKNVLIIRVDFSDLPGDPTFPGMAAGTAAQIQNVADTLVAPYYPRSSYGLTSLTNTVTTQLYRMPQTAEFYATGGDNAQLHTDAEAAAAADYTLTNYDRIVVVFSFLGNINGSLIDYGGLAQLGGTNVWINGEFDFRVVTHELGHTYGLYHASLWQVTDGNPISPNGTTIEYGDDFDTMGANYADDTNTDFNPFYKNILGWIRDDQVTTITTNGTYRIYTFDWNNNAAATNDTTLAVKYVKGNGKTYWIGARRNFTANNFMQNGAYVIWGYDSVGAGGGGGFLSGLLDLNTPGFAPFGGVNSDYDAALGRGQTFVDADSGLVITPIRDRGQAPNSYLELQVGYGSVPDISVSTNFVVGGNDNGVVDPDECNQLYLVLTNKGGAEATHLQATLSTRTPGVIITRRDATFPDIGGGGTATNTVAFQFSTVPTYVCGTPVIFTLTLKSDQITSASTFSVKSGLPGTPLRYDSTRPLAIPDNSTVGANSPVVVSGFSGATLDAKVSLYLTHTYDQDLTLELISPDGVTNILAANVGGSGNNFGLSCADIQRTVFDDAAEKSINAGFPPFVGSYQPLEPLSVHVGQSGTNVNGTWYLRAVDQAQIDVGTIQCWSLFLTPSICTDGGGECPGSDLTISGGALPEPVLVGSNLVYSITVTNRGPKTAKGTTFNQVLPSNVVYISGTISQGSLSYAGGVVSGNIGSLAPGVVVTAKITVIPTQAGTISSTANVSATSDPDFDLSNNTILITSHVSPPTSDLAVGLVGAPNPVLLGNTLTYTVSVTNNGPSIATGVMVSNQLPASVTVVSASPSQGTTTTSGNLVLFNFGAINSGGLATATISVLPGAQGAITATATARANQNDPLLANNTAKTTVVVGPAADLAARFQDVPGAVVLGSNLVYTVVATNSGLSAATAVVLNQSLPPGLNVLSSSSSQGTLTQSNNVIVCSVGNLPVGGSVQMTVVGLPTTVGTNVSSVVISAAESDPNTANNTAVASTIVAEPFVNIVGAGATLTAESFSPADGTIEPGETVTVQLRLRNDGNTSASGVSGQLLPGDGVTLPSGLQSYGTLAPGAFPVAMPFTFTASGTNGGTVTAMVQLHGSATNVVNFDFSLPSVASFENTNAIVIPSIGAASPYPSTIEVSNIVGTVGRVSVTLSNFNHTYPHDVSALLVGPTGAGVMLFSHASSAGFLSGANLTFDDSAPAPIPDSGAIATGTWQPAAYPPAAVLTNPAPAGPYAATLGAFTSLDPNGTWSLYIVDDSNGDEGAVSNGWSLAISTVTPVNQIADLTLNANASPDPAEVGSLLTNVFTIGNNGTNVATSIAFTNTVPPNATVVSAAASQGSVAVNGHQVTGNLSDLTAGSYASVVVVLAPQTTGWLTNSATVASSENDLNPGNNSLQLVTAVGLPLADLGISQMASSNSIVIGSNFTYTITVTNAGPSQALNAVVTDTLPAGVGFVSASVGSAAGSIVTCNLGALPAHQSTNVVITARALALGSVTNHAGVATSSTDTNNVNNGSSFVATISGPAPYLVAAGATLKSESQVPADGAVGPGETVKVSLALANNGTADTTNLVATLQNTGGVTASSGSQNFGVIHFGGASVVKDFTFTGAGSNGGVIRATLKLADGGADLGTVVFNFNLPLTTVMSNSVAIVIPDHGTANPYPSAINVSGVTGIVSKVTVSLNGFTHAFPHDVGVMLVSPSGIKSAVMANAGGGSSVTNVTLTFDDSAPVGLSESGQITSGTYRPTYNSPGKTFLTPVPGGITTNLFADFNGMSPNGTWALYVLDDAPGDGGAVNSGWTLNLTTVNPVNPAADLTLTGAGAATAYAGTTVSYSLQVLNKGPQAATDVTVTNTLPASSSFISAALSQGGYTNLGDRVVFNLGNIEAGANATLSLNVMPTVPGTVADSAFVSANETDLNLTDNSAQMLTSVKALQPAELVESVVNANGEFQLTLTGQAGLKYAIQFSTDLRSWTTVATNTAAADGTFKFVDSSAGGSRQRFYRAVLVP